jgi:hypothetical protein
MPRYFGMLDSRFKPTQFQKAKCHVCGYMAVSIVRFVISSTNEPPFILGRNILFRLRLKSSKEKGVGAEFPITPFPDSHQHLSSNTDYMSMWSQDRPRPTTISETR